MIALAFDESLKQAMQARVRSLVQMITERVALTAAQAYSLCSMAADVRITQVVNVKKGFHVMIPKTLLNHKAREA